MLAFVRGEADVLVATSIIESGLDIPQANTLVVERADQLGLCQLYQIRGRVGRSDVTAHAYLLYPDAATLSRGRRPRACARWPTTPSSAAACGSRCATSRSAAPATCWATSRAATSPRSASSSTWRCSTTPSCRGRGVEPPEQETRVEIAVSAYIPSEYVPLEAAKIDLHRRIAMAVEPRGRRRAARRDRGPLRAGPAAGGGAAVGAAGAGQAARGRRHPDRRALRPGRRGPGEPHQRGAARPARAGAARQPTRAASGSCRCRRRACPSERLEAAEAALDALAGAAAVAA